MHVTTVLTGTRNGPTHSLTLFSTCTVTFANKFLHRPSPYKLDGGISSSNADVAIDVVHSTGVGSTRHFDLPPQNHSVLFAVLRNHSKYICPRLEGGITDVTS